MLFLVKLNDGEGQVFEACDSSEALRLARLDFSGEVRSHEVQIVDSTLEEILADSPKIEPQAEVASDAIEGGSESESEGEVKPSEQEVKAEPEPEKPVKKASKAKAKAPKAE